MLRQHEADALMEALGVLAAELGEHEEAFRVWSTRSSLGRSDEATARASLHAAEAATALGRGHEARFHLERARAHAAGPVLTAEVLAGESVIQRYLDGDPETALITASRALEAVRPDVRDVARSPDRLDEPTRRAWLHAALAAVEGALSSDDPERMLELAEELATVAAGVDDRIEAQALVEGAMALRFLGRNADAAVRLRLAWDQCARRVMPESTLQVGTALARVLVSLGRLREADTLLRECGSLRARVGSVTPVRAFGVVLAGLLELSTGSWQTGVERLRAAAEDEPSPHFRLQAHLERAAALSRLDPSGGADEVRESVAAALVDADAAGCRRCRNEAAVRCSQALFRTGALDEGRNLAARAEISRTNAYTGFWSGWARATLLVGTGHPDAAAALDGVVADAERQDLHLEALWVRLDLASHLGDRDRATAVAVLARAGADAERMGAMTEKRIASRSLRALGVRAWRRGARSEGSAALDVLTAREREVAGLVARGASNPEIAEALPVSQDGRAPRLERAGQARSAQPSRARGRGVRGPALTEAVSDTGTGESHMRDSAGRGGGFDLIVLLEALQSVPEAYASPEQDGDHRDVHVVDESGGEEVADHAGPSAEAYILAVRSRPGRHERLGRRRVDEVERRAAVHLDRRARVMGEDEGRGVERRVGTPPALPLRVLVPSGRAELPGTHDLGADPDREHLQEGVVDAAAAARLTDPLGPGPGDEHPLVQPFAGVAERCLQALTFAGGEPVERDGDLLDAGE
jgi:tetratricopeptide (TPR) repeat protein